MSAKAEQIIDVMVDIAMGLIKAARSPDKWRRVEQVIPENLRTTLIKLQADMAAVEKLPKDET